MEKKKYDNSFSTKVDGPIEKRRRMSDSVNMPINLSTTAENKSHKLTETRGSNLRINRIRNEMNNLWDQERRILEDQEEISRQRIIELELRLVDAREARATAESQFAREKNELKDKITELMNENVKLGHLILQQTTEGTSKLNAAADMISKLQKKLISNPPSEVDSSNLITTELEEAKIKIEKLESEKMSLWVENQDILPRATRAKELEEELKLADQIISNLRETVTEKGEIFWKNELKDADSTEVDRIDIKHEVLGPEDSEKVAETVENESSSADDTALPLDTVPHEQVPQWCLKSSEGYGNALEVELPENQPIWVGEYYVLASHSKFFDVNWEKYYQRKRVHGHRSRFACKLCEHTSTARVIMEDHIWRKHYGERFKCPLCPNPISWRYDINKHMKTAHSKEI